jgi:hypothetical protein
VNPRALSMPLWEQAWRLSVMHAVGVAATAVPLALGAGIRLTART